VSIPRSGTPLLADTHAHLDLDDYRDDRAEVIGRARAAGVGLIVNVGFDEATSRASIALAEAHPFIHATVGLHPHHASSLSDDLLATYERLAAHPKVVAVGETGLDHYRDLSPRVDQERAFRAQVRLAKTVGLPLVIHSRDARADVLRILDDEGVPPAGGVMHCFPGDEAYAEEVVARGLHVGVGGPVTYSARGRLAGVAAAVRQDRLVLETDAPWLPPVPHRGERNEPSFVRLVAERVAALRGVSVADLARLTTGTAMRLFRIPERPEPSIAYEMWGNLYLNVTNRCTNECSFCIRYQTDVLWGYNLKLDREPSVEDVLRAVGDPTRYREVVFCGFGEPTERLDVVVEVGRRVRAGGGRVRLDTNGHGSLIAGRSVVPDLATAVDAVSVSLNAPDAASYERLCGSRLGARAFEGVLEFVRECVRAGIETQVSAVDVPGVDVAGVRAVAASLGVPLRVRGAGVARRTAGADGGDASRR
jgi:TatD DNase family protein